MAVSQFEAKTFGVGELITQRKLFRVPPHQRSYAWDKESVDAFLQDIETAISNGASDYFIGLIVIQASEIGEWILLDGQQRLTTVSLVFAGLRHWLLQHGLEADATQIHNEYLGVRRLGGTSSSRMLLNTENQAYFQRAALEPVPDERLKLDCNYSELAGSNKLLLQAAFRCRSWVRDFARGDSDGVGDQSRAYDLARFLDQRLKVVAVEVSSDVDAYVLFESLNDRGVALSALDLVKNHILSRDPAAEIRWQALVEALGDENPEDFLKIFWTNRRGVIQKSQIFKGIKSHYPTADAVNRLLTELMQDANTLSALQDDDHPIWTRYRDEIRDSIFLMRALESKQWRPVVIALLRTITDESVIAACLRLLTTAIVRFQVIGKGRTGVVEKVFGRICQSLSNGRINIPLDFKEHLAELLTTDEQFRNTFESHEEKKFSRIAYFLAADRAFESSSNTPPHPREIRKILERNRVVNNSVPADHIAAKMLGAFTLSPTATALPRTELSSTPDEIVERTSLMADHAPQIWNAEC